MSAYLEQQEPDEIVLIPLTCPACGLDFTGIEGEHTEDDCPACAYESARESEDNTDLPL